MFNLCYNQNKPKDTTDKIRQSPILRHKCQNSKSPLSQRNTSISKHIKSIVNNKAKQSLIEEQILTRQATNTVIKGPTISIGKLPKKVSISKTIHSQILTERAHTKTVVNQENLQLKRQNNSKSPSFRHCENPVKTQNGHQKQSYLANVNRITAKCKSIRDMFSNIHRQTTKVSQQVTFGEQNLIENLPPEIKVTEAPVFDQPKHLPQNIQINTIFLAPGFDPRRISTIFSYEDDQKAEPIASHPVLNLKLERSSKCRLAQSNIDGLVPNYRVEESIVQNVSILNNFHILNQKNSQSGDILMVVQKHIGFLLSIKRVNKEKLKDISNQMLFYNIIGQGHSTLLGHYNILKEQNEYLILKEYYEATLKQITLDQESLAKLINQLLFAFQFFMDIGLVVQISTSDIVLVNGKFRISGFRSFSKSLKNDLSLIKFYCGLLSHLIQRLIEDGHLKLVTNLLDDFLRTLREGIFCPAALRLHAFLQS